MNKMKILIFGTGVIGSLYGALLAEAGHEVSLYARGARLKSLQENGLRYRKNAQIRTAKARILSSLKKTGRYDFIILTVRENQLFQALEELKDNESPTIVTMVNSLDTYDKWEAVCGKDCELPALLALHGLRRSELLALTADKITGDMITVSGSMVFNANGQLVLKSTNKNETSQRTVCICTVWQ